MIFKQEEKYFSKFYNILLNTSIFFIESPGLTTVKTLYNSSVTAIKNINNLNWKQEDPFWNVNKLLIKRFFLKVSSCTEKSKLKKTN